MARRQKSVFAAAVTIATCTCALTASAEDPQPTSPDAARAALEQHRVELENTEQKAKSLQSNLTELDTERERIQSRLVETGTLIQRSEARMTTIEGRLSELEAQEKIVRGSLNERHGQIASLLGALQRMGRNPPPVLITRREDALQMVRSAMMLSSAFPELKGQALKLTERLTDLQRVMTDIRREGERLEAETNRLNDARTRLASLMEAKKLTFADRQSQLAAVKQETITISKNVQNLSELITRLDQTVVEKAGPGASAAPPAPAPSLAPSLAPSAAAPAAPGAPVAPPQTSVAAAAPAPEGQPSGPRIVLPPQADGPPAHETDVAMLNVPGKPPPGSVVELAPQGAVINPDRAGRFEPAIPFASARGKLPLPAHGRRLMSFGDKTQFGNQSKGMVLATRFSGQVTSPCDGWVLYAGEFRTYGQLLIIDARDGYHVLLAGMSQIDVEPGQFVLTAEPVGTMGAGPQKGPEGTSASAPVLYIEFRKDERPIDPDPWWASSQQKVQR